MEDFIDADKELEQTGASLKKAAHENETQKAALAEKDHEISDLRNANAKYERELLEVTSENLDQKAALAEKDQEITDLRNANAKYEQELLEVTSEKLDLETWVTEIKACVTDVNAYHRNLETKTQTQNDIIGQLKAEIVRLQRDLDSSVTDHEMNKKALLRSNAALKREIEKLKVAVVDEQDKAPAVDWKAQCMLTHRCKTLQIEELEAEIEVLRVSNWELCEGLETLMGELVREESEGDEKSILGCAAVENAFFEAVTVADMPPCEVIRHSAETEDMSQSTVMGRDKREIVGSAIGPVVLLGCLLAALLLRW